MNHRLSDFCCPIVSNVQNKPFLKERFEMLNLMQ